MVDLVLMNLVQLGLFAEMSTEVPFFGALWSPVTPWVVVTYYPMGNPPLCFDSLYLCHTGSMQAHHACTHRQRYEPHALLPS